MNKVLEEITVSVEWYPVASSSVSSSTTLKDMSKYRNALIRTLITKLPDGKGEGVTTLTVYENTASTWNGAVATPITSSIVTGSLTSVSNVMLQTEITTAEMDVNNSKRYIGAYLTMPTTSDISMVIERCRPRYEPQ